MRRVMFMPLAIGASIAVIFSSIVFCTEGLSPDIPRNNTMIENKSSVDSKISTTENYQFMTANRSGLSTKEEHIKDILSGSVGSTSNFAKLSTNEALTAVGKIVNKITNTTQIVEGIEIINAVAGLEIKNSIEHEVSNSSIIVQKNSTCYHSSRVTFPAPVSCTFVITISR